MPHFPFQAAIFQLPTLWHLKFRHGAARAQISEKKLRKSPCLTRIRAAATSAKTKNKSRHVGFLSELKVLACYDQGPLTDNHTHVREEPVENISQVYARKRTCNDNLTVWLSVKV